MEKNTNIGTSIKSLAVSVLVVEVLAAIISLLVSINNDFDELPLILGLCGLVTAWPLFLLLCAFGELVEKTIWNEQNTDRMVKLMEAQTAPKSKPAVTAVKAEAPAVQPSVAPAAPAFPAQENSKKVLSGAGTIVNDEKVCPNCGTAQRLERRVCWHCGLKFEN